MADLELVADSGVFALTGGISGGTIRLEITESLRLVEGFSLDIDLLVSSGFGFGETTSEQFSVGVAVAEALKLNSTSSTVAVWTQLIYDQASLSAAIKTAQALSVNEGLTLDQTTSLALAITIAQTLFLRDASQPLIDFNLSGSRPFTSTPPSARSLAWTSLSRSGWPGPLIRCGGRERASPRL